VLECTTNRSGFSACLAAPPRLTLSIGHRSIFAMTQKTFRVTWWLLMMLSAIISIAAVVYLQVS
jgi:hypothetical protein